MVENEIEVVGGKLVITKPQEIIPAREMSSLFKEEAEQRLEELKEMRDRNQADADRNLAIVNRLNAKINAFEQAIPSLTSRIVAKEIVGK